MASDRRRYRVADRLRNDADGWEIASLRSATVVGGRKRLRILPLLAGNKKDGAPASAGHISAACVPLVRPPSPPSILAAAHQARWRCITKTI